MLPVKDASGADASVYQQVEQRSTQYFFYDEKRFFVSVHGAQIVLVPPPEVDFLKNYRYLTPLNEPEAHVQEPCYC